MRRIVALSLLVMAGLMACGSSGPDFKGSVQEEPVTVPDFTLTDQYGQPFRLSDQRGDIVMLFFGYTSCPDVCPTTLATWRKVHEGLGEDADRVRFAFVTVDPERDTPERLGLHVNAFNPDFVGLSGAPEDLVSLYEVFDVYYEKVENSGSALGYLVNHTASAFLIDPEGQWRLRVTYATAAEDIVHDIQELLEE